MVAELVQVGGVVGLVMAVTRLVAWISQLVVIIWSFRADDRGRRHAIRVLEILRNGRRGQKPP